jgi:hypothetical protein
VSTDEDETPDTFPRILRELPRKTLALVLLVSVVNLGVPFALKVRAHLGNDGSFPP